MTDASPHERGPLREESMPEDLRQKLEALPSSEYAMYVRSLKGLLTGRAIVGSSTGHSGFMVELDDQTYVVAYLDQDQLRWKHGVGTPTPADFELMASPCYGDGTEPLGEDRPYASERCDIAAEVRKAHGHTLQTVSIGEDTFNLAFADAHELDTMIVTARDGKPALRVFWEQW